jgi:hypothetical protein
MAFRSWGNVLLAALGAAAVTGTGQLGVAYGLGVLRLASGFTGGTTNQWAAQLAWLGWFAGVATVVGAVTADRLAERSGHRAGTGSRIAFGAAAAVGGAVVAPLSMLPARDAQLPATDPVLVTSVTALLGALAGIIVAFAALTHWALRHDITWLVGAVWALALLSVLPSIGPGDPLPTVRLGMLDPPWLSGGVTQRVAVVTMPALALVVGAGCGALARWRRQPLPAVAGCGAAGPALLALAYLIAGPGTGTDRYQATPYWGALFAVAVGALGSVLAATMPWPGAGERPGAGANPGGTHTGVDTPAPGADAGLRIPNAPGRPSSPDTSTNSAEGAGVPAETATDGARDTRPGTAADGWTDEPPTTADFWPDTAPPARPAAPPAAPARTTPAPAQRPEPTSITVPKPVSASAAETTEPTEPGQTRTELIGTELIGTDAPDIGRSKDGGRIRGLLRRGRSAGPIGAGSTPDADSGGVPRQPSRRGGDTTPAVPERDAEYVAWVSGLSAPEKPADEAKPAPRPRRSPRSRQQEGE